MNKTNSMSFKFHIMKYKILYAVLFAASLPSLALAGQKVMDCYSQKFSGFWHNGIDWQPTNFTNRPRYSLWIESYPTGEYYNLYKGEREIWNSVGSAPVENFKKDRFIFVTLIESTGHYLIDKKTLRYSYAFHGGYVFGQNDVTPYIELGYCVKTR